VRNEEAVQALFAQVEPELGSVEVCLFNAGADVKAPLIETSGRLFFEAWEFACYGGFLTGREAARYMEPRGRGTILFTGATASVRGASGFAAFAAAKFGLRAIAPTMAREIAPKNIHVAHLVIDGAIDKRGDPQATSAATGTMPELPPDGLIQTSSVAEAYWALHNQRAMAGRLTFVRIVSGGSGERGTAATAGAVGGRNQPHPARPSLHELSLDHESIAYPGPLRRDPRHESTPSPIHDRRSRCWRTAISSSPRARQSRLISPAPTAPRRIRSFYPIRRSMRAG
jgi:hypothetical protein